MKLITWNVNSLRVRLPQVLQLLAEAQPDALCLQELKLQTKDFPSEALAAAGYPHQLVHGQKTYNGVAILSRLPIEDPVIGFTHVPDDPQARAVRATVGGVRLVNVYVPNGEALTSEKYPYKLDWLARFEEELRAEGAPSRAVVGDMNIAPADADVYDPFAMEGGVLVSPAERAAFARLLALGLADTWREKHPHSTTFTHWDYRARAFTRNMGYRIDHILLSPDLLARCTGIEVLKRVRGWEQPSDHAPVAATFG